MNSLGNTVVVDSTTFAMIKDGRCQENIGFGSQWASIVAKAKTGLSAS